MKSMTGYGKGVSNYGTKTLTVELKSVNNRFLEINSRLPKYGRRRNYTKTHFSRT